MTSAPYSSYIVHYLGYDLFYPQMAKSCASHIYEAVMVLTFFLPHEYLILYSA